jgi:hypothetical protein
MVPPPARQPWTGGLRLLRTSSRFAEQLWMGALPVNHRYDKLGHAMPLELHGCGCGLCARQQRLQRQFWEAR